MKQTYKKTGQTKNNKSHYENLRKYHMKTRKSAGLISGMFKAAIFSLALIAAIDYFDIPSKIIRKYNNLKNDILMSSKEVVIKTDVKTLEKEIRKSKDIVARFGGEEFVILLQNTDKFKAIEIAERIKEKIV